MNTWIGIGPHRPASALKIIRARLKREPDHVELLKLALISEKALHQQQGKSMSGFRSPYLEALIELNPGSSLGDGILAEMETDRRVAESSKGTRSLLDTIVEDQADRRAVVERARERRIELQQQLEEIRAERLRDRRQAYHECDRGYFGGPRGFYDPCLHDYDYGYVFGYNGGYRIGSDLPYTYDYNRDSFGYRGSLSREHGYNTYKRYGERPRNRARNRRDNW
jgi:hypothetical protein